MASNTIEEAISVVLKASTTVTDFVGTGANARIYWIKAPANTTMLPYITYQVITRQNDPNGMGARASQIRAQVSVWNDNKRNGQDLAQNIVELFDQRTDDMDGFGVLFGNTTGPIQLIDPDSDNLFQWVVDLLIDFNR